MTNFLLQAISDQKMSAYHPFLSQSIILLFTFALIGDLFGLMGQKRATSVADWLIVLGASLCFPAIITGMDGSMGVDPALPELRFHAHIAYAVTIFSTLYALFRLVAFFKSIQIPRLLYVILSVALVYLTSWTATFNLK